MVYLLPQDRGGLGKVVREPNEINDGEEAITIDIKDVEAQATHCFCFLSVGFVFDSFKCCCILGLRW